MLNFNFPFPGFDNEDGDGGDEEMDESGVPDNSELQEEGDSKRAITWQMAKNKGLTPHRKKEQRNPRVKHRNKFRKAKIRRKGQVRYNFPSGQVPYMMLLYLCSKTFIVVFFPQIPCRFESHELKLNVMEEKCQESRKL